MKAPFTRHFPPDDHALFERVKKAVTDIPKTLSVKFVTHKLGVGKNRRWWREYSFFTPTPQMLALAVCETFKLPFQEGVFAGSIVHAWNVFPGSGLILDVCPPNAMTSGPVLFDPEASHLTGLYTITNVCPKNHRHGLCEETFNNRLAAVMHVFTLFTRTGSCLR